MSNSDFPSFTLVTPTGDRPQAFALCEQWMARQQRGGFKFHARQWLVLDDGEVPTVCTMDQEVIRCPEFRGSGSLVSKIHKVASTPGLVKGNAIAIIEDDDYYAPNYLSRMADLLDGYAFAGEGQALYYNVEKRWYCAHNNTHHASLCSTVLRTSLLPLLAVHTAQADNPFIDTRIWGWHTVPSNLFLPAYRDKSRSVIGIKSMPGRLGYGNGHNHNRVGRIFEGVVKDPTLDYLVQQIGMNDALCYAPFYIP